MIRLVFTINRETLQFVIKAKTIYYADRKWGSYVQCVPKDPNLVKRILMSRNKIPLTLIKLFDLNDKDQAEYDNAKTEEDLATIIIKDCKLKGCKFIRKEIVDG